MSLPRAASALLTLSTLLLGSSTCFATTKSEGEADALLLKELEALENPSWQNSGSVALLSGYESNPLLSSFAAGGSTLARVDLEDFALHPNWHGLELIGMLHGSVTRYLNPPPGLAGEQNWFVHAELRSQPYAGAKLSLAGTAYLMDEVLDLSVNDTVHQVAPLRVWGEKSVLKFRQKLPSRLWLELAPDLHHSSYLHYAGDFTELGGGVHLGWDSSSGLALSLGALQHRRAYATRTETTLAGRSLEGTRLHLTDSQAESTLAWKKAWHGNWQVAATTRLGETRDGASGYFDYRQNHAEGSLSWEQGAWKLEAEVGGDQYRYITQTVGMGLVPPARTRQDRNAALNIELHLREKLLLSLSLRLERSHSNEAYSDYTNRSLVLGLHREF